MINGSILLIFLSCYRSMDSKTMTSTKDKIKKRFSIPSINFLKRKKKEDNEETYDSKNETREDIAEEKADEKVFFSEIIFSLFPKIVENVHAVSGSWQIARSQDLPVLD